MSSSFSLNHLSGERATLTFGGIVGHDVEFQIKTFNIPSITGNPVIQPTPLHQIPVAGDHLEYSTLDVSFLVTEDMSNYQALRNWMIALYFPDNTEQYENLVCDAAVNIYTSHNRVAKVVKYKHVFPVNLGEIPFTTEDTEHQPIITTASFAVEGYTIT